MKFLLAIMMTVSVGFAAHARTLSCNLFTDGWNTVVLHEEISLDEKPTVAGTQKITSVSKEMKMEINGTPGKLYMRTSATWIKDRQNGFVKLNNMSDTFPIIEVGAFFYKDNDPNPHPGPLFIAVGSTSGPSFKADRNSSSQATHELYAHNSMSLMDYPEHVYDYSIKCDVLK